MTLIEQLKAIRALIDTPDKWAEGAYARDKDGDAVPTYNSDAVCYCLSGAEAVICLGGSLAYYALKGALPDDFDDLPTFNDHADTKHADVMAVVDRAIEVAS